MDQLTITTISGAIAAIVAAFGVFVTWYLNMRNERRTLEQIRLTAENFALEWRRDLRLWAASSIDALSDALHALETNDNESLNGKCDINIELRKARIRLSSLVEQGRFFLPNSHTDVSAPKNSEAFRGYRHAALDPLVASIKVISGVTGTHASSYEAILHMRRLFVSSIQKILAPNDTNQTIVKLLLQFDKNAHDITLGGLITENDNIPSGSDALLWQKNR